MATKVIECFEVQDWDGGERHNHSYYIESEPDPMMIKQSHAICIRRKFVIHETVDDLQLWKSGDLKKKALEKLTPEERAALGF